MRRKKSYIPLNIYIGTRYVGKLVRDSSGAYQFQYSEEWLNWEMHFPISLSLPAREDAYIGQAVINVFENLLPDHEDMRRLIAIRVGAMGTDTFSLLSKIGRDCVGAMQILPEGQTLQPCTKIEGRQLSETEIEYLLNNLGRVPLGLSEDEAFRISIAGAQEKIALLFHNGMWIEPHGSTPTTHILKPPIKQLGGGIDFSHSVENEHFCLKLLEAFGLPVAETRIGQFGNTKALIITRFDRYWADDNRLIRLPQEDCCQALSVPPTMKYQDKGGPGIIEIANLLNGSDTAEQDRLHFMKANILFWLMGATDGHAKNFSLFLLPGGSFRMTPFYDVLTVQPFVDQHYMMRKNFRLSMRVGKRRRYRIFDICRDDFLFTGQKAGYSERQIKEVMALIEQEWQGAFDKACSGLPNKFPHMLIDSLKTAFASRVSKLFKVHS